MQLANTDSPSLLATCSLQRESKFAAAYAAGIHKTRYWEVMYEDSMDLIAKLPQLAALIYRRSFKDGQFISPLPHLDWAANLSHMMGVCFHCVWC
jgi:citrate synthase